jgi:cytochrome c
VPGRHRTGPSLAGVIGRRAGTAPGFRRYSAALKQADIDWDETALDAWIADPGALIPGNRMVFRGLPDPQARADLIAFLAQPPPAASEQGGMGGGELPDLATLGPEHRVTAIRRCGDGYDVTTANGGVETYWETNLRFKTDGSDLGPEPGKPVIVGAGMVGDRASIIFAAPDEISPFILPGC